MWKRTQPAGSLLSETQRSAQWTNLTRLNCHFSIFKGGRTGAENYFNIFWKINDQGSVHVFNLHWISQQKKSIFHFFKELFFFFLLLLFLFFYSVCLSPYLFYFCLSVCLYSCLSFSPSLPIFPTHTSSFQAHPVTSLLGDSQPWQLNAAFGP